MITKKSAVTPFSCSAAPFFNKKKAVGPLVPTVILLVAVIGVVTFQTWFNTYSSSLQNEVETRSSNELGTRVERVVGDTLYFRNGGNENISINRVVVGDHDCNISQNTSSGINNFDLGNCTSNISESATDVVVYTNKGIFTQKFILDTTISSNEGSVQKEFCEGNNVTEYNGLCWYSDMNGFGSQQWAISTSSTYSQPTYNGDGYIYPAGTTESDYPAFEVCNTLNIDGYDNWRLPNLGELNGKRCDSNFNPTNGFSNCINNFYWTQNESSSKFAKVVDLSYGGSSGGTKDTTKRVACVRGN